jgi:hypothetical protein
MKQVIFKDGRTALVDADSFIIPQGVVRLTKRTVDGMREVQSYPAEIVKDVKDYTVTPVKVLAIKLYTACSATPHGSRKLAEMAGIEYSDLVLAILKKLREAGKVAFADGKWTRV